MATAAFQQGNEHPGMGAVKATLSPEARGRGRQRMSLALDLTFLKLGDPLMLHDSGAFDTCLIFHLE